MLCQIIPIITGIISITLGYWIGKNSAVKVVKRCLKKITFLEEEKRKLMSDYNDQINIKKRHIFDLKNEIDKLKKQNMAQEATFDAKMAKLVYGKTIKQDDLTIIEGIGPKIQELFKNNGITNWEILSQTSEEKLKKILISGGERFAIHNPSTWPRQATLAHQGKWQELKQWQNTLFGGIEPKD